MHEVNFGGNSPDVHCANYRAFMWRQMKDWLAKGAVPDDERFAQQLGSPGYHVNRSHKLVIEAKQDAEARLDEPGRCQRPRPYLARQLNECGAQRRGNDLRAGRRVNSQLTAKA